ncbi:MAG: NAD(P)/FAD-dependent oxidoreductase [Methanophagales archaeon]|nr:NAD(P)/FAD-dependent oxidoreductase [Methanophagales archaeon]MCW3141490.1 NAD(P)/FAD-dependent oxidoreductase [Methanophagales archaeon]
MKQDYYDIIIVGAGPAGLFAANELKDKMKVLIIEKGKDVEERNCPMEELGNCINCAQCNIMCGVGGAGTFSDGTLNLRPDIGGDLAEFCNHEMAWQLVNEVDRVFLEHGMPDVLYKGNEEEIEELKRRAASVGASFVDINQRHIGSDKTKDVIKSFKNDLTERGIEFMLNTCVTDLIIEKGEGVCKGVITDKGEEIRSRCTILAPGRVGASWVEKLIKKHGIEAEYAGIDVGVRVEVLAITMNPVTRINRDPKFHIRTKRYDDFARTFCINECGFVVKEVYDDFIGVNGHSMKTKKSENTNFAFLVRVELTKPVENTTRYGRSIAKLATTIGGGKPIVQRMGDLRRGRRSTWGGIGRNLVRNTLTDVTPGDISMALPHRITMDIIEGLEKLNEIIPGVMSDSTLLYAPEIKFYAMRLKVDKNMETSVENLFAAGDGAGLSRDIVNAAATGILAARGVMQELKIS